MCLTDLTFEVNFCFLSRQCLALRFHHGPSRLFREETSANFVSRIISGQDEQFSDETVKSGCEQSKRMIWTLILKTQEFFNCLFLRNLLAKQGGRETYTQKMPWTTYWLIGVLMETEQSVSSALAYWDGGQWKTLEVGCPPNPTLQMIFFHCLDGQDSSCWCQGAYWDFH